VTEKAQVWRYYRYDNYAVLQTLESVPVNVGDKVNVTGVGATYNGNNKLVVFCPQYKFIGVDSETGDWNFDYNQPIPNQFMYQSVMTMTFPHSPPMGWSCGNHPLHGLPTKMLRII